jgi:hypothetical protein
VPLKSGSTGTPTIERDSRYSPYPQSPIIMQSIVSTVPTVKVDATTAQPYILSPPHDPTVSTSSTKKPMAELPGALPIHSRVCIFSFLSLSPIYLFLNYFMNAARGESQGR